MPDGIRLIGGFALAGLAGAGMLYIALLGPEPAELPLTRTSGQFAAAGAVPDSEGWWSVQPGSRAGFRVRQMPGPPPGSGEMVVRTEGITGGLAVQAQGQNFVMRQLDIVFDVSRLTSGVPATDEAFKTMVLQTDRFPTAGFKAAGPLRVPATPAGATGKTLTLEGTLTIKEVTRDVSIPMKISVQGETAQMEGSFTFPMAQFGIQAPFAAGPVAFEPTCTMEIRLLLGKAA